MDIPQPAVIEPALYQDLGPGTCPQINSEVPKIGEKRDGILKMKFVVRYFWQRDHAETRRREERDKDGESRW
jgi:hypothetical protein